MYDRLFRLLFFLQKLAVGRIGKRRRTLFAFIRALRRPAQYVRFVRYRKRAHNHDNARRFFLHCKRRSRKDHGAQFVRRPFDAVLQRTGRRIGNSIDAKHGEQTKIDRLPLHRSGSYRRRFEKAHVCRQHYAERAAGRKRRRNAFVQPNHPALCKRRYVRRLYRTTGHRRYALSVY